MIKYLFEYKKIPKIIKECSNQILDEEFQRNEILDLLESGQKIKAIGLILDYSSSNKIDFDILKKLGRCAYLLKAKETINRIEELKNKSTNN